MRQRVLWQRTVMAGLTILVIATALSAPMVGMETITWKDALFLKKASPEYEIFWNLRVPRVCLAFLAGAGLALSGMAFQAMFRNVLATPFTLGVASGASFGAAVGVRLSITLTVFGLQAVTLFAFLGAGLAIALVYVLGRIRQDMTPSTMLLAGVAVSFMFSSLILLVQYTSSFTHSFRIVRWLMGSIEVVGFEPVVRLAPLVVMGSAAVFVLSRELNLLMMGDEISLSRGLEASRVRTVLFLAVSVMVGGVVSVCGPIGFVGMMAPHIMRIMIGADHRRLAPATLMFGGVFLTLCDTLARCAIAPAELPVGVITALLGGPFFIGLLVARSSYRSALF